MWESWCGRMMVSVENTANSTVSVTTFLTMVRGRSVRWHLVRVKTLCFLVEVSRKVITNANRQVVPRLVAPTRLQKMLPIPPRRL